MSETAREEILARVKRALKRDDQSFSLRSEENSAQQIIKEDLQPGELVKRFELELTRIGGHSHIARTADAICDYIENLVSIKQTKTVIGWNAPVISEIRLSERLERSGVEFIPNDDIEAKRNSSTKLSKQE